MSTAPAVADIRSIECAGLRHSACPSTTIICQCRCHTTPLFQLYQWKAAIKLEALGMKHSSGRSVRLHACRVLGIALNLKHEGVIEELKKIIALRAV